jgi:hypothetical protein
MKLASIQNIICFRKEVGDPIREMLLRLAEKSFNVGLQ